MPKNVIHIFGASGSGTTTLGSKICAELGFTHLDSDDYLWIPTDPPYTTKREAAERVALMRQDVLAADNAVISGSLVSWGNPLIPLFTLAIRLVTPTDVRIERLIKRERENFGSRLDVGGDMHEDHLEFIEWARAYDTADTSIRSKAMHDQWQKSLQCKLIILDGTENLITNFEIVKKELGL